MRRLTMLALGFLGILLTMTGCSDENVIAGGVGEYRGGCTCSGTMIGTRWCDNGDGTVTDLTTCLVWLRKADWGGLKPWRNNSTECSIINLTCYDDANTRAGILESGTDDANLSDGSVVGDWLLPTQTELYGLAHGTDPVTSHDMQAFTGVQSYRYWSSTTYATHLGYAWGVDLGDGYTYDDFKYQDYYVWPVRAGQ